MSAKKPAGQDKKVTTIDVNDPDSYAEYFALLGVVSMISSNPLPGWRPF